MLNKIIQYSLHNRLLVMIAAADTQRHYRLLLYKIDQALK